jgi:hypothetical protein
MAQQQALFTGYAGLHTSKSNPEGSALKVMKALIKHRTASLGDMLGATDTRRDRDRDRDRCLGLDRRPALDGATPAGNTGGMVPRKDQSPTESRNTANPSTNTARAPTRHAKGPRPNTIERFSEGTRKACT